MASNEPHAEEQPPLADLESRLGYEFDDPGLLRTALTHASFAAENEGEESYERLEFLGDVVLGLFVTARIFEEMNGEPEGSMTKVRATVVNEAPLAEVARELDLHRFVRLGVGEAKSGGADRDSLLSDLVESILGAVYVDGGADAAATVVERLIGDRIIEAAEHRDVTDSRSRLQEILAQRGSVVEFSYERSGPDHATVFQAVATVDGAVIGEGAGSSKKAAAIAASANALARNTYV